jgi:transcriptional regulator with XRE-family HTH domain
MFEGSLGKIIKEFRKRQEGWSQDAVMSGLGFTGAHLIHIENGKAVPDHDLLLNLYEMLVPQREKSDDLLAIWLIKWVEARINYEEKKKEEPEPNKKDHKPANGAMLQQAHEVIGQLVKQHVTRLNLRPEGHLRSLENFPDDFRPLTIITGDRRPSEPREPGDVFVGSAAITDLMFLPQLGLPKECRIRSDRIFALMNDQQLRQELGQTNLLVIGSGTVNLATRVLNEHCLFRFRVRDEAKKVAERVRSLSFRNDLNSFRAFWQIAEAPQRAEWSQNPDYRVPIHELQRQVREIFGGIIPGQYVLDFGGPEFIDTAGETEGVVSRKFHRFHDRAIVSLGRNPYAESDRFVTIMAAGAGAVGTAHAVRALGRMAFDRHPFGGILDTELDSSPPPKDFEEARCDWINPQGYTPEALLHKLESALSESPPGDPSLSSLKPEEIRECRNFVLTLTGHK